MCLFSRQRGVGKLEEILELESGRQRSTIVDMRWPMFDPARIETANVRLHYILRKFRLRPSAGLTFCAESRHISSLLFVFSVMNFVTERCGEGETLGGGVQGEGPLRFRSGAALMSILRQAEVKDYDPIIQVIDDWWGGRPMAGMLHRLFFEHFQPTSFVIEQDAEIVGFLVGFRSQTVPTQAYIHFVGVHPAMRGQGMGRRLYEHFFEAVRKMGCSEVRAITSPVNTGSIAFHTRMGFAILPGDAQINGVAVTTNYDGRGSDRVLFRRDL
jgi:N-acetylglutamate synthase-like GNAT family acetyltransferase